MRTMPLPCDKSSVVLVDLVIQKDGYVSGVRIKQTSGNYLIDREAFRLMHLMPDWIPGTINGEAVDIIVTVPVTFY
jgi:TonB family protein